MSELSRFRGVNRDFPFRFQNIVLIAFDLLAPESFQEAKKWLHEVAMYVNLSQLRGEVE